MKCAARHPADRCLRQGMWVAGDIVWVPGAGSMARCSADRARRRASRGSIRIPARRPCCRTKRRAISTRSPRSAEALRLRTSFAHLMTVFLRRLWLPRHCLPLQRPLRGGLPAARRSALAGRFLLDDASAFDGRRQIHDATKVFAFFVCLCVFAFQMWIAERVLVTIFRRQGMEAWKSMINDIA